MGAPQRSHPVDAEDHQWDHAPELPVCGVWFLRESRGVFSQGVQCPHEQLGYVLHTDRLDGGCQGWQVRPYGRGPLRRDLHEQEWCALCRGLDVTMDGACEANRPTDQKKNKKWHSDCKVKTAAMHPFKKPKDYFECLDQTMAL